MNVNSTNKCLFKVYARGIALCVEPFQVLTTGTRQQCLSCILEILVNFRLVLAPFLCVFIAEFKFSLFTVYVIKYYFVAYLCVTPNRRYIYGSCYKTLVCNCVNDWPYRVLFRVYQLLWGRHF